MWWLSRVLSQVVKRTYKSKNLCLHLHITSTLVVADDRSKDELRVTDDRSKDTLRVTDDRSKDALPYSTYYRTVRLGFSKLLGNLVAKYVSAY